MKERKRKITVITVIGIMLILAITTFTYAIWSRTHIQTGINKNTYACFDISYEETNGDGISIENGFPQTDEQGMQNDAYEVEIKNTCDTVSTYNVILNKEQSSDLDDTHLKVAVDNDYKLLSDATLTDTREISGFQNEASYIIGSGVIGPQQTKVVKIRSWMDKDTSEQDGEDKSFTFKITIENAADSSSLKNIILSSQPINNEITDFYVETVRNNVELSEPEESPESISACNGKYEKSQQVTVGKDYLFDENTGKFSLTNIETVTSLDEKIGWYVLQENSVSVAKIMKVSDSFGYEGYDGCSYVSLVDYYYPMANRGIVFTEDDDGTSYVYRGEVDNNYVKFADKIWRIVRINGDGTIRIILNDKINELSNLKFNKNTNDKKYVGYTYDNGKSCTNDNPCDKDTGTSSTIKQKLETWYQNNLQKYDNKIALTKYCNDTTTGHTDNSNTYYAAYDRLNNNEATLKCPDTDKDYGGLYKLKIGLLSVEEGYYAGLFYGPSYYEQLSDFIDGSYLNHNYWWHTLSPQSLKYMFTPQGNVVYGASRVLIDSEGDVLPVINLNKDVTVIGSGTQEDPYVVQ